MPIGTDAWTMAACRAVARGGHLDSWVRKSSAMVGVGNRLILASGGRIFDLDVSRPDALEVRGRLDVWEPIAELRADRWDERAYGVSGQGCHQSLPTFDLRGGNLSSGSEHDIGSWVERRDGTGWTAMVRKNGRVVVAEVLR